MDFKSQIESLLFIAGRPVSLKELEKVTTHPSEEIQKAIAKLQTEHANSGIIILEQNKSYLMSTSPENSLLVKDFLNTDLREKLTEAALETLAIITYKQPVTRAEIEAIRGVNSQYTVRHLMMRGLIEKNASEKDARTNLYRTTHEFLQHLGLKNIKDLPDFTDLTSKVKAPEGYINIVTKNETPPS